jgi:dihydropteroate synthase
MGILNVTPDSFSDGGQFVDPARAVDAAHAMAAAGADLIDVGGESTRPGAAPLDALEERRRVVPVLERLARELAVPLSIDTMKSEVAAAGLDAGALIVNDVSGLDHDPRMARLAAERRCGLVLMHMRGTPADMAGRASYVSVVDEVASELAARLRRAVEAGVDVEAIVLDPGLGFAKRAEHSVELLARLDAPALARLDRPWLVGASRKSFLQLAVGECPPAERDWATAAAVTASVLAGAHIVRVHRVAELAQVVRVADLLAAARA